jgi:hypothetical protein
MVEVTQQHDSGLFYLGERPGMVARKSHRSVRRSGHSAHFRPDRNRKEEAQQWKRNAAAQRKAKKAKRVLGPVKDAAMKDAMKELSATLTAALTPRRNER